MVNVSKPVIKTPTIVFIFTVMTYCYDLYCLHSLLNVTKISVQCSVNDQIFKDAFDKNNNTEKREK